MGVNLWGLFERVAAAVPDREAIVWRERRLTYGEVAEQAVRLANVLVDHGLGVRRERDELVDYRWAREIATATPSSAAATPGEDTT